VEWKSKLADTTGHNYGNMNDFLSLKNYKLDPKLCMNQVSDAGSVYIIRIVVCLYLCFCFR